MARIVALIALFGLVGAGVVGYTAAQDESQGTPSAEFCASPEASPSASPEASPEIITSGTPEVVATSVTENIEGGLDETVCGTPIASPAA